MIERLDYLNDGQPDSGKSLGCYRDLVNAYDAIT